MESHLIGQVRCVSWTDVTQFTLFPDPPGLPDDQMVSLEGDRPYLEKPPEHEDSWNPSRFAAAGRARSWLYRGQASI